MAASWWRGPEGRAPIEVARQMTCPVTEEVELTTLNNPNNAPSLPMAESQKSSILQNATWAQSFALKAKLNQKGRFLHIRRVHLASRRLLSLLSLS